MNENKRFKLHIEWYNKEKTDGEATLYERGQPLGVIESMEDARLIRNILNELYDENEELKKENKHYKYILQDLGLLMTDKEVRDIRIEMADKIIKPLCKENGFDVDVDCTNGFTIIPKR